VLLTIRSNSYKVLPGIAFGTSSQHRLRLFSQRIRRPQLTGCRRVVRPRGESPGRVASQSGCFPWEIRSCPAYWAAPGGPAPGRKPWSVLAGMQVAKGCQGLPLGCLPPPSPYEIRPPRRPMWSYTGFPPPLQVVVPRIRSHEAVSRSALLQVPNSVYSSTNRYPVATGLPR